MILGIMVVRPYFELDLMMAFLERVFMDDGLVGKREKVDWWEWVRGREYD